MAVKRQGSHELPGEVRHGPLRSAEYLSSIHNKLYDFNRPDMCPFDLPCQSLQTLRFFFFYPDSYIHGIPSVKYNSWEIAKSR